MRGWGLPQALHGALEPSRCKAPGCLARWSLRAAELANDRAVVELTVSHVLPRKGKQKCEWKSKNFHGLLYRPGASGAARPLVGGGGLLGVLTKSGGGLAAVVTEWNGQLRVYTPTSQGKLEVTQSTRWNIPHEENLRYHTLAPACGP